MALRGLPGGRRKRKSKSGSGAGSTREEGPCGYSASSRVCDMAPKSYRNPEDRPFNQNSRNSLSPNGALVVLGVCDPFVTA